MSIPSIPNTIIPITQYHYPHGLQTNIHRSLATVGFYIAPYQPTSTDTDGSEALAAILKARYHIYTEYFKDVFNAAKHFKVVVGFVYIKSIAAAY